MHIPSVTMATVNQWLLLPRCMVTLGLKNHCGVINCSCTSTHLYSSWSHAVRLACWTSSSKNYYICISGTDHSPEPRKLENTENEVVLLRWLVEPVAAVAPSEVGGVDLWPWDTCWAALSSSCFCSLCTECVSWRDSLVVITRDSLLW